MRTYIMSLVLQQKAEEKIFQVFTVYRGPARRRGAYTIDLRKIALLYGTGSVCSAYFVQQIKIYKPNAVAWILFERRFI